MKVLLNQAKYQKSKSRANALLFCKPGVLQAALNFAANTCKTCMVKTGNKVIQRKAANNKL